MNVYKISFLFLLVSVFCPSASAQPVVSRIIDVGEAWSGHRVGFAMHTHRTRQYVAYYNPDRHIVVGQRNLTDKRFDLDTLPVIERKERRDASTVLGWDSHNYLTIGTDDQGYIHLAGNMHVHKLTYFKSTQSGDITSLKQVTAMIGEEEERCTYPNFLTTNAGDLIFRYRDGGSGNGNEIYNIYDSQTSTWSRLLDRPLLDGEGLMNAYTSGPIRGPAGWYHMHWVWRNTPDCATNHHLSYVKSPDLVHWYDISGQALELPITLADSSAVVDPILIHGGIINGCTRLSFDQNGEPVMVYHKYDDDGDLELFSAKRIGNSWKIDQMTDWDYRWEFGGSGTIIREVILHGLQKIGKDSYRIQVDHVKHGKFGLVLNSELQITDTLDTTPFAETLPIVGDRPEFTKRWKANRVLTEGRVDQHIMIWESLPTTGDKPRPKPWPDPSLVQIYELKGNPVVQENWKTRWKSFKSSRDISRHFSADLKRLYQSLDLKNNPALVAVRDAYADNKITITADALIDHFKKSGRSHPHYRALPPASQRSLPLADSICQGYLGVQGRMGQQPRDTFGLLDWNYTGPADDKEYAWGVNRHYHIVELLNAYQKTGNSRYVTEIDRRIKDWVLQSLPYPGIKSSSAMWRGLEVSFRVKTWAKVFYELLDHPGLSDASRLLMLISLPDHAHYAREFHAKGNWLTMELSGLATLATVWPEFEQADSWLAYSRTKMMESMAEQVYPDGVQTELTSHYHWVALRNFELFDEICSRAGNPMPHTYRDQLKNMWNYLAVTMRPDGYGLLNNDSDRDYNAERVLDAGIHYSQSDWTFIASQGKQGTEPIKKHHLFPWAGQVIMRSGFEEQAHWGFFDIGPWGSGHQHSDKLHLSLMAYGQDHLVDAGRFAYRGDIADKFRPYARSSISHNTLAIDGKDQESGPLVSDQPIDQSNFIVADDLTFACNSMSSFRGLDGEARHLRSVTYLDEGLWIVLDKIETDRPRTIRANWHFHPEASVEITSDSDLISSRDQGNLSLRADSNHSWKTRHHKGQTEPNIQGWYSPRYNVALPSPSVSYETEISDDGHFLWVFTPVKEENERYKVIVIKDKKHGTLLKVADLKMSRTRKIFVPFEDSKYFRAKSWK